LTKNTNFFNNNPLQKLSEPLKNDIFIILAIFLILKRSNERSEIKFLNSVNSDSDNYDDGLTEWHPMFLELGQSFLRQHYITTRITYNKG